MNYLAIILVFVIVIILYLIYYYFTNTALTSGLQKLNEPLTFPPSKLSTPGSSTYSYQGWFFISNSASDKSLFHRTGTPNKDFDVKLTGNTLIVKTNGNKIMQATTEFPLQKWVYLVINVNSNGNMEAYLNGKLVKTVNASIGKPSATASLVIGDATGLNGYVTKFTRLPSTLTPQTVQNNYLSGNGMSSIFSKIVPYGMNFAISNGEELQRVVKVF